MERKIFLAVRNGEWRGLYAEWFLLSKWFSLAESCSRHIQSHLEGVPASSIWTYWHRNRSFTAGRKHSLIWSLHPGCGSHGQYSTNCVGVMSFARLFLQMFFFCVITVINNTQLTVYEWGSNCVIFHSSSGTTWWLLLN